MDLSELETLIRDAKAGIRNLSSDKQKEGFDVSDILQHVTAESDTSKEKTLLKHFAIIDRYRGSTHVTAGSRASGDHSQDIEDMKMLLSALRGATEGRLTRSEGILVLGSSTERWESAASALRLAEIARGVQGAKGGLKIETVPSSAAAADQKSTEKTQESDYYDAAQTFLERAIVDSMQADSDTSHDVYACGDERRLPGPWNTPDVVGWWVEPCPSLLDAVLRLVAVEVKLTLQRQAIAQAESYGRFAHYSWVVVPRTRQELTESSSELVTECAQRGLGLACFKNSNSKEFYAYISPTFRRPDETQTNLLLEHLFPPGNDRKSHIDIAGHIRRIRHMLESET